MWYRSWRGRWGVELEVSNAHVRHIKTTSRGDNAAGDGPSALIGVLTEMRRQTPLNTEWLGGGRSEGGVVGCAGGGARGGTACNKDHLRAHPLPPSSSS